MTTSKNQLCFNKGRNWNLNATTSAINNMWNEGDRRSKSQLCTLGVKTQTSNGVTEI